MTPTRGGVKITIHIRDEVGPILEYSILRGNSRISRGTPGTSVVRAVLFDAVLAGSYVYKLDIYARPPGGGRQGKRHIRDNIRAIALSAPDQPMNFAAAAAGNGEVMLSWDAPDPSDLSIQKYEYRQKAAGGNYPLSWTAIPNSDHTTASYTVPNLTNGTAYTFQVRAVNTQGSTESAERTATPTVRIVADTGGSNCVGALEAEEDGTVAIGTATGGPFTPQLSTSSTYGSFQIESNGNWVYTLDNDKPEVQGLKHNERKCRAFPVQLSGGGGPIIIYIAVVGVNDAPTGVRVDWRWPSADGASGEIPENTLTTSSRAKVADLTAKDIDTDDTHIFFLEFFEDSSSFEVVGSALYLKRGTTLSRAKKEQHHLRFGVKDGQGARTAPTKQETLTVTAPPTAAPAKPADFTATAGDKQVDLAWPRPDAGLWGTVGYGEGEVEIDDEEAGAQSSDSALRAAALGGQVRLFSDDDLIQGGTTALTLKGEAWAARFDLKDDGGRMRGMEVDVRRLRLGLEGEHARRLVDGSTLTPSLELGLRHDDGDGEVGRGVELGGGLTWSDPVRGLTAGIHGRTLLAHHGDLEEWGVGGQVTFGPGVDGHGLSFSLEPSWGEAQSGLARLWEDGLVAANDPLADDAGTAMRLDAEIGYGRSAVGGRGVLTPYSGLSLSGDGNRIWRLGQRLEIGPAFHLGLEAERRESADDAPDHSFMLRATARW